MTDQKIDKALAGQIAREMQRAAEEIAKRHGLHTVPHGVRYDPLAGTWRAVVEFQAGTPEAMARRDFEALATLYGLEPSDFGRTFRWDHDGREYRVAGVRPRAKTASVLVVRVHDGKRFAMPSATVRKALNDAGIGPEGEPRDQGEAEERYHAEETARRGAERGGSR
jgi:hypothetical protein